MTESYPGRYVTPSAEVDALADRLFHTVEELHGRALSASSPDAADRIDKARDALEWITGDLDDIARRAREDAAMSDQDARNLSELLNLLDLLPTQDQDPEFWTKLAEVQRRGWDPKYLVKNLLGMRELVVRDGQAGDEAVRDLASYCLMFFGSGDQDLWTVLDRVEGSFSTREEGAIGRRWAESVADVAWRLYVPREAARRAE